jgi:hypothetical protein
MDLPAIVTLSSVIISMKNACLGTAFFMFSVFDLMVGL